MRRQNIFARVPDIIYEAWQEYGDARRITSVVEVSAQVSTNQVFRLELSDRSTLITKVSSYGSFFLFREDHDRIHLLYTLLQETRYRDLLADALLKNGDIFTYYDGDMWVIFYNEIAKKHFLPRILGEEQIAVLATRMAEFHNQCDAVADRIPLTSKSIKSDIIHLLELLRDKHCSKMFRLRSRALRLLQDQCHEFLTNLDDWKYDYWRKLPILIDWNLGNFSVEYTPPPDAARPTGGAQFQLFSRWDYDWFRIEPTGLDFYFFARVASQVGDRTDFSYLAEPLLEPRFRIFLRAYHAVRPLTETDLLFLKEYYRFFILNYVILEGEHFFREAYCDRLRAEAIDSYLPGLAHLDFRVLLEILD